MKKVFEVKAVESHRFNAVSFSLDSTRPEDYYPRLESSLRKLKVHGKVLLDLLACNGFSSRRFFAVEFDGIHLKHETLKHQPMDSIDSELLAYCKDYYALNVKKLSSSVLPMIARKVMSAV